MLISLVRTIILYVIAMFAVRMMGKRQIGELQPSELVITILVSELATLPMQDFDIPLILGIIPICTLIFLEHIVSFLSLKNTKLRRIINGNPCIVVTKGQINIKVLRELRMSVDELVEELRVNNVTNISDVEYAIVETNGQLSCILAPHARPVDASQMDQITLNTDSLPLIIVNDGCIIFRNLKLLNKDKLWLENYIHNRNNIELNNIFLMTLDIYDNVFIQEKEF